MRWSGPALSRPPDAPVLRGSVSGAGLAGRKLPRDVLPVPTCPWRPGVDDLVLFLGTAGPQSMLEGGEEGCRRIPSPDENGQRPFTTKPPSTGRARPGGRGRGGHEGINCVQTSARPDRQNVEPFRVPPGGSRGRSPRRPHGHEGSSCPPRLVKSSPPRGAAARSLSGNARLFALGRAAGRADLARPPHGLAVVHPGKVCAAPPGGACRRRPSPPHALPSAPSPLGFPGFAGIRRVTGPRSGPGGADASWWPARRPRPRAGRWLRRRAWRRS